MQFVVELFGLVKTWLFNWSLGDEFIYIHFDQLLKKQKLYLGSFSATTKKPANKPIIPPQKKILVLDLDETLVHSTAQPLHAAPHLQIDKHLTIFLGTSLVRYGVIKRPFVLEFLQKVQEWYDVVIFTASVDNYANPVIDFLDTKGWIKKRYFRDSCVVKNGLFIKDLSTISSDLSQVVIIDNSPEAYSLNEENAIPIAPWFGFGPDEELLNLLPFLDALRHCSDVRSILSLRLM